MSSKIKFNEIVESGCFKNGDVFLYKSCLHEFYLQMIKNPSKKKTEFKLIKIFNTKRKTDQKQITSSNKEKKLLINSTKFNNIVTAITDLNRENIENKKIIGWRKNLYLVRNNKKTSIHDIATQLIEMINKFDIDKYDKNEKFVEINCLANNGDNSITSLKANINFFKNFKSNCVNVDCVDTSDDIIKLSAKNIPETPKKKDKKRKLSSMPIKDTKNVIDIIEYDDDDDLDINNDDDNDNNNNVAAGDIIKENVGFESFNLANYFLEMLLESLDHSNKLLNILEDGMIKKLKQLYSGKKTKLNKEILLSLHHPLTQLSKQFFFDTIIMNVRDDNFKNPIVNSLDDNEKFNILLENEGSLIDKQKNELRKLFDNIEKCILLITNTENKLTLEKLITNLSNYHNDKLYYNSDTLDDLMKESFNIVNLIIANEMKPLHSSVLKISKDNEIKNKNKSSAFSYLIDRCLLNVTTFDKEHILENFENGNITMDEYTISQLTTNTGKLNDNKKILNKIEIYLETIKNIETTNEELIKKHKLEYDIEHDLMIKKIKVEHEKEKQDIIHIYETKEREITENLNGTNNSKKETNQELLVKCNEELEDVKKELQDRESRISRMKNDHEIEKQELLLKVAKFCDLNEDFKIENKKLIEEKSIYINKIDSIKKENDSKIFKIQNLANEIRINCYNETMESNKEIITQNDFEGYEIDTFNTF